MITELKIKNFRRFKEFELKNLGLVNLLVGENNGGKTSVLEAVQLLKAKGDTEKIAKIMKSRNEFLDDLNPNQIDICQIFHNHKIKPGSSFFINSKQESGEETLLSQIYDGVPGLIEYNGLENDDLLNKSFLKMEWKSSLKEIIEISYLIDKGGLLLKRGLSAYSKEPVIMDNLLFVSSGAMSVDETVQIFKDIVLNPEEELVIDSLNIIEPSIARIAITGTRGGLAVKCRGIDKRIPIGNMGDGIWRLLGITLALVKAKDGILLIDEIDTGLHFTVMEKMWNLIIKTAEKLNVQVFATTHNSDCWTSLAAVLQENDSIKENISIQRIEKNKQGLFPLQKMKLS